MKKLSVIATCSFAVLAAPLCMAACDYPNKVDIPTGMTATKEDMLKGQTDVKAYVAAMEEYLACIVNDEKVARSDMDDLKPEDEQQREDLLNKKYNAAVDEMETMAAAFNNEVQAYRSRDE